jgi:hypothetical protein
MVCHAKIPVVSKFQFQRFPAENTQPQIWGRFHPFIFIFYSNEIWTLWAGTCEDSTFSIACRLLTHTQNTCTHNCKTRIISDELQKNPEGPAMEVVPLIFVDNEKGESHRKKSI